MSVTYSFGPFRLDAEAEMLFRGTEPVSLGRRAVMLLRVLAEQQGAPVSKEALMQAAWPGLAVEESNLTVQIAALRRALGEEPGGAGWIETLPRRGYRFAGPVNTGTAGDITVAPALPTVAEAALPDKPSIAVLPFINLSGDPGQDYFSDGMTEDIITELSRFSELFVIARNSSFQYKGKAPDVRQVGRDLGVRYVLEGSVRRAGDRVRITGQLIDTGTGAHRWAERYDRELSDVFAVQDEVARSIVSMLTAHVQNAEIERVLQKPPATWHSYEYYLRAVDALRTYQRTYNKEDLYQVRRLLEGSLAADPNYARSHALLSFTFFTAWVNHIDGDCLIPEVLERAFELASRSVQLDPDLPDALTVLGLTLSYKAHHAASLAAFERASLRNPNFTDYRYGLACVLAGQHERAVGVLQQHMRRDPFYPAAACAWLGLAHYLLGNYEQALPPLRECISRAPNFRPGQVWLAATCAQCGELDEASAAAAQVRAIEPFFTISGTARRLSGFKRVEDREHLIDGMRKSGLPEL